MKQISDYRFAFMPAAIGLLLIADGASAGLVYIGAEHVLQASAVADETVDQPDPVESMALDPAFDDSINASATAAEASASASAEHASLFSANGFQGNGTFSATASGGVESPASADAYNLLLVSFYEDSGQPKPFTLEGTIENFDATGASSGFIELRNQQGYSESVIVTDDSQSFSFTGNFVTGLNNGYVLEVSLEGAANVSAFGTVDSPSSGSFDFEFAVVPVPAAVWLFGSALGILGLAIRKARH